MGQQPAPHDYAAVYRTALQVNWRLDDVVGDAMAFDFGAPFLPDAWVAARSLDFLTEAEQRVVNHLRAHSYLCIFGFAEEYFLPFLVDYVRTRIHRAPQEEIRAILHFAEEESKHIELFQRFSAQFRRGFAASCEVIGPPAAVAEQILGMSPLGVALSILQLEWLTQLHYVATVRNDSALDPHFVSLLRHHWLEEAQHTKLDAFVTEAIAADLGPERLQAGIDDYVAICQLLNAGFTEQVELDLASFTQVTGRRLSPVEARRYRVGQRQSYCQTFLTSGTRHPRFQETLLELAPAAGPRAIEMVCALESQPPD